MDTSGEAGRHRSPRMLADRAEVDVALGDPGRLDQLLSALAVAAGAGDEEAMAVLLYAINRGRLAEPGVRRVIAGSNEVADIVQDVLLAVAQNVDSYRAESKFTTWLFGIARHKAIAHLRRRRPTPVDPSATSDMVGSARMSSVIANRSVIGELLSELEEPFRSAVILRDIDGLTYDEIATVTDTPVNTVRSRISRGRHMLTVQVDAGPDLR